MPIDPKIRLSPSPARVPVLKPEVQPAPAPAVAQPTIAPTATQVSSFDRVPANQYAGVRDPSIGVKDNSIGVKDNSIGVKDHSIGVKDHSIGNLGPKTDDYERSVKTTIAKYLELPSYLRDDAPVATQAVGLSLTDAKAMISSQLAARQGAALLQTAQQDPLIADRLSTVAAGLKALPADSQKQVLSRFAESPNSASAKVLENVLGSDLWRGLKSADKASLAKVMSVANEKALVGLGALLEGTPECAAFKDTKGRSLFANLSDLASQPLNSALYGQTTGHQLLDETLLQIANPDRIAQGNAPTCTVTSMQFELVRDEPAEYARLLAGLVGQGGVATMAGGGELKLVPAAMKALSHREASQAIFQDAAMDYADGSDKYDARNAISRSTTGDYPGLMPRQQTTLLKQLFGVKYETDTLETPAARASALQQLRDYVAVGKHRPVLLEIDQGNFNHAVTFEMEKNDRVYFRDPYGQLRSMPDAAFIDHVVAVHKPQTKS